MTKPHIRPERLTAYFVIDLTVKAVSNPNAKFRTIGEIVDEALRLTDESCNQGKLSIDISCFETDPEGNHD